MKRCFSRHSHINTTGILQYYYIAGLSLQQAEMHGRYIVVKHRFFVFSVHPVMMISWSKYHKSIVPVILSLCPSSSMYLMTLSLSLTKVIEGPWWVVPHIQQELLFPCSLKLVWCCVLQRPGVLFCETLLLLEEQNLLDAGRSCFFNLSTVLISHCIANLGITVPRIKSLTFSIKSLGNFLFHTTTRSPNPLHQGISLAVATGVVSPTAWRSLDVESFGYWYW